MQIQRRKAQQAGISLSSIFIGISEQSDRSHEPMIQKCGHSPWINSDESRIMQVLLILQSNALKFTKRGEVKIIVELIKQGDVHNLKMQVVDTGIGIS